MKIQLKLFATLASHLPPHARLNVAEVEVSDGSTAHDVIDSFGIPREEAYLVIRNGVFLNPLERDSEVLNPGDILALWPPVAGG